MLLFLFISVFVLSNAEITEVFIIPHSHCDPGWLQTLDVCNFAFTWGKEQEITRR